MDLFKGILHFLENNSVAAFFGAFSAFLLVVASDRWRKRKRKNLFVQLVADTAGAVGCQLTGLAVARARPCVRRDWTRG